MQGIHTNMWLFPVLVLKVHQVVMMFLYSFVFQWLKWIEKESTFETFYSALCLATKHQVVLKILMN